MLECKPCEYKTNKISNYNRHLQTDKHNRLVNNPKQFKCDICCYKSERYYNYERHLEIHKHKEIINKNNNIEIFNVIKELLNLN